MRFSSGISICEGIIIGGLSNLSEQPTTLMAANANAGKRYNLESFIILYYVCLLLTLIE